jgi:pantoate kinase
VAFAPSIITNFFKIEYSASGSPAGATGGGYILSKGTFTTANQIQAKDPRVVTKVNGDSSYDARTTKRAVELLLDGNAFRLGLRLDQKVETPIGAGFGTSGASATSAVFAAAAAIGSRESKRELALYAHRAEIFEQTGLGTVSVNYDHVGAGAITKAGEPGVAEFVSISVPKDVRLVTAYLAPFDKKDAFSSSSISQKVNELGEEALRAFVSDPSLDTLGSEGEIFSNRLGLESPEVRKLIMAAKRAGATYASQNMIGYSVHSVVPDDRVASVAKAFRSTGNGVRIDQFEIGKRRAGVIPNRR